MLGSQVGSCDRTKEHRYAYMILPASPGGRCTLGAVHEEDGEDVSAVRPCLVRGEGARDKVKANT